MGNTPGSIKRDPYASEAGASCRATIGPLEMDLQVAETNGTRIVEGAAGESFMRSVNDASRILEACFSNRTTAVLLYHDNVTPRFFDLSSAEAGLILDKLRYFQIRLAIVCPPGTTHFSRHFTQVLADDLRVFETRDAARGWLSS
jgi:Domain of unknown function (DUF4180)